MNKRGLMNKRVEVSGNLLAWVLLSFFTIIAVLGLVSNSICDKLLVASAIFGLTWLLLGGRMLIQPEKHDFIVFLFITLILMIIWIILNGTGSCSVEDILKIFP